MKMKNLVLFFSILCLLTLSFTPNIASAQDEEPPSQTEDGLSDQTSPAIPGFKVDTNPLSTENNRSLSPATDLLIISSDIDYEKTEPKVAFGLTEYGVAYEKDGNIYVTFVKYDGTILNTYLISTHDGENGHPDIAFEGSSGLFVVAYEDYYISGNIVILCRAVDPNSGPVGNESSVADTLGEDDYSPSLDCNHNDGSCLVVFTAYESPISNIMGRFMQIDSNGVHEPYHSPFLVTTTYGGTAISSVSDPMVTWGWNAGAYIVVGTANMDTGDDFGFFSLVHETYQSTGDQYMTSGTHYLVDPFIDGEEGWEWLTNDIVPTSVTYDPCTEKFLVLFTHDWNGTSTDFDLLLQMVDGVPTMNRVDYPIWIAWSSESETSGDISFLTNAWYASQYDIGPDRAAVAYHRGGDNEGIITTVIEGNCSSSNPYYSVLDISDHVLVRSPYNVQFAAVDGPVAAGSDGEGGVPDLI